MMQPVTAPRSLKEKQRQEREALILQAAEEVLMEKGYYETSIDEIAARVGIAWSEPNLPHQRQSQHRIPWA